MYPIQCAYLHIGNSGAIHSRLHPHRDGVEEVPTALQDQDVDVEDPALRSLEHAQLAEIKDGGVTVGPRQEAADLGAEIVAPAAFELGGRVGRTVDGEDEAAL